MFYPLRLTPLTSSLSRTYIIPALLLNPILFLHSLNAILSRLLPPIIVPNVAVQPPPYTAKGPSAQHPHLDIHASDRLCWSYTIVMVGVQLVAFGRVQMSREERKERIRRKPEGDRAKGIQKIGWGMDGTNDGACNKSGILSSGGGALLAKSPPSDVNGHTRKTARAFDDPSDDEDDDGNSEESELIL